MFLKLLLFLLLVSFCNCVKLITLNGDWIVQDNKNNVTNVKAKVPGGIYSDLMNNGIIDDVFYGYNDRETNWVPRLNWTYSRIFSIEEEILYENTINLVFEGLDTFSSIYINEQLVGTSDNMFVQYIFDLKKYIKAGANEIQVRFLSPIETAANLDTEQSKNYSIPPACPPLEYNGECHVNMIRKMQASFSWDWGPSYPSVGIWKDVYIESYNESVIRYILNDVTEKDEAYWDVDLDIYLANNIRNRVRGKIQLDFYLNFINLTQVLDVNENVNEYNEIIVSTKLEILKTYVNTWWPNGYGASHLYTLKVTYKNEDSSDTSIKSIRIGFRTIQLVQDMLKSGLTFYFKVNNVPIFMKGSNEIPIDILPERGQNKTKIRNLLSAAKDSHMNMIRVWGGGVYESDYFYDVADEFGILIWQDFMFACAMYPTTDIYLQSVISEVRHQVKRLYGHACIAIFSGNNENEGALVGNWYNTAPNYKTYLNDYIKLYVTTIKNEFIRMTHNRSIFITSSPTNGKQSDIEGYVAKKPTSTLYGDVHFYNYILDPFNEKFYPVPRFASEYGYQSLPSVQSFLTATNNTDDTIINSVFMTHRQHHPFGNIELQSLIGLYFKSPNQSSKYFNEAFIYYTQIVQALAIRIETEHYRRYRSSLNVLGEGYTMGALYWQLNDVWVAPSWSGIDYLGRWKMLQYYTQNFFAPLIITGYINLVRTLEIHLVSDLLSPLENLTVSIQVFSWKSFKPLSIESLQYALCLLLIVLLEIAVSLTAYNSRNDIESTLEVDMYNSMRYFKSDTKYIWSATQYSLRCCGVLGPKDWNQYDETYNLTTVYDVIRETDSSTDTSLYYTVPNSCCLQENCIDSSSLYHRGCLPKLRYIISQSALLLGVGAMCITFIQLLGAIFAHLLARSIRKLKTQIEVERTIRRQQIYEQLSKSNTQEKVSPVLYVPSSSEA